MKYLPWIIAAVPLALGPAPGARADVKMPAIFADHMVLQQDLKAPVWGTAGPGEAVTVTVGGHSAKTTAGPDGKWMVRMGPFPPDAQATTMTVAGRNTLKFGDVLIGEVWICSGQSNMAFALGKALDGLAAAAGAGDGELRLFTVARRISHQPVADLEGKWEVCTPQTAGAFSAVGYFFGRELREKLRRPVGLIAVDYGGSSAVAWTGIDALEKAPEFHHYVKQWKHIDEAYSQAAADYPAAMSAYGSAMKAWTARYGAGFFAALGQWNQEREKAIESGGPLPPKFKAPAPVPKAPKNPEGDVSSPATLYDGMVAPLAPYGVRGVIWYQGESDADRAAEYGKLFPLLITDWRQRWGEDFPFLYVQLAGYRADDTDDWAQVREGQLQTLSLPKTGMASAVDIGEPNVLHPVDKRDVGERLALVARHVAYGEQIGCSGPIFKSVTQEGKSLRVEFDQGGLVIGKPPHLPPGVKALPADRLAGFEVAGADGNWKPAEAKIDGGAVLVSSTAAAAPAAVRYGWSDFPEGNLYNKEGLPASPFRAKAGDTGP